MRKKLLTVAMVATMAISSVLSAFAAADIDCTGWWVAHTEGFEVTADGVEVNFKGTTYDTATFNHDTPVVVVYAGDEAKVNGNGYLEYAVVRSDNYAWAPDNVNGVTGAANTGAGLDNWTAAGYKIESTGAPTDDAGWATWLEANKAGADCTVKATKDNDKVTLVVTNSGITSTTTIPVDATKTIYISLSGELCKVTDIKVAGDETGEDKTTPAEDNTTKAPAKTTTPADKDDEEGVNPVVIVVIVVVAVVVVAGILVATKKKK